MFGIRRAVRNRAVRRRFAILGVLAEDGPSTGTDICYALRLPSSAISADLDTLVSEHRIKAVADDHPEPRTRYYRLPERYPE
jgi:DNA-binding IclR family transcriptional regulator